MANTDTTVTARNTDMGMDTDMVKRNNVNEMLPFSTRWERGKFFIFRIPADVNRLEFTFRHT